MDRDRKRGVQNSAYAGAGAKQQMLTERTESREKNVFCLRHALNDIVDFLHSVFSIYFLLL